MDDTFDIVIKQGATWTLPLNYLESDETAVDITGWTARMQVRRDAESEIVVELSTTNGKITLSEPTEGELTLKLTATETTDLDPGTYRYDLELVDGSEVYRILEGTVTITEQITR